MKQTLQSFVCNINHLHSIDFYTLSFDYNPHYIKADVMLYFLREKNMSKGQSVYIKSKRLGADYELASNKTTLLRGFSCFYLLFGR